QCTIPHNNTRKHNKQTILRITTSKNIALVTKTTFFQKPVMNYEFENTRKIHKVKKVEPHYQLFIKVHLVCLPERIYGK
ncbi:MAG TPA: hypothetical protein PLV00_07675, partial [Caldisericia bacterium]|nr:hypothetical protein [Caldisericia bacterium]